MPAKRSMDISALLALRLRNTGLSGPPSKTPAQAVAALGAVQSQDYHAAKWTLGQRIRGATDAALDAAFNAGDILRTHVLRPTWHFVVPADIRWMLELTGPRIRAKMAPYDRNLKLDAAVYAKCRTAIAKSVREGEHPTRQDLKEVLAGIGVETDVQRLAHIIMDAEISGVICSGPRDGKQFTYASLDERAPAGPRHRPLPREEAVARLALLYFRGHGPAQAADFAWWSGLTGKDAAQALEAVQSKLARADIDGKTYWHVPVPRSKVPAPPRALLLSIYDEYTIAYADRGALSRANDVERMIKMGNALNSVLILDGKVAGTWKRTLKGKKTVVALSPFRKPTGAEQEALDAEVERLVAFHA